MFAAAAWLLVVGRRRAFESPDLYRGKVIGPILAVASLAGLSFRTRNNVCFATTAAFDKRAKGWSPCARIYPGRYWRKRSNAVTLLSDPLAGRQGSGPSCGVLLIFYRGYW
jgi:hypothetical protein